MTWNFGKLTESKIMHLIDFLKEDESRPIYFIGLQEIRKQDHEVIVRALQSNIPRGYTLVSQLKDNSSWTSFLTEQSFCLLSILVHPRILENISWKSERIQAKPNVSTLALNTKGYLFADFTIEGIPYTFVNIHLPFVSGQFTKVNLDALFTFFRNRRNMIILGDFNTRSTLDDTCTVSNCKVDFVKDYKGPLHQLESSLNQCRRTRRCKPLIAKLVEKDFLKPRLGLYREGEVGFLPSYKVTPDGAYQLKKRLPGYADRVIIRGDLRIVSGTYRLLKFQGNDHLPVAVDVQISREKTNKTRN